MAVQWVRFAQQGASGLPGTIATSISTGGVDCIVVFTLVSNNLGDAVVDSVVFNGTESLVAVATGGQCTMWILMNPTSTIANVAVTASGSGDVICVFGVSLFTGVDTPSPIGTAGSFTGFTATPSFTLSNVQRDDFVVAALGTVGTSVPATTIGSGQEKKWEVTNGPNSDSLWLKLTGSHQPGIHNAARTCNVTHSSARSCACVGAPIRPEPFFRTGSPSHVSAPSVAAAPTHVGSPSYIADPV